MWYGVAPAGEASGTTAPSAALFPAECFSYLTVPVYNNFENPGAFYDSLSLNLLLGKSDPMPIRSLSIELASDLLSLDWSSLSARLRFLGNFFFITFTFLFGNASSESLNYIFLPFRRSLLESFFVKFWDFFWT